MVKQLIRLYPARWRQRYGQELAGLLEDLAPLSRGARLRIAVDVARGALDAHLSGESGARDAVRAMARAAGAAMIASLPLAASIFLSNVTFASSSGGFWFPVVMVYLLVAFPVIGAVAGSASARPGSVLAACAVAGAVIAGLVMATYAAIDNAFPAIVIRQPEKMTGFRASGMTSARDFLNLTLERQIQGVAIIGIVMGLFFGMLGAMAADEWRQARRQSA
jgi:hypothetical protein